MPNDFTPFLREHKKPGTEVPGSFSFPKTSSFSLRLLALAIRAAVVEGESARTLAVNVRSLQGSASQGHFATNRAYRHQKSAAEHYQRPGLRNSANAEVVYCEVVVGKCAQ